MRLGSCHLWGESLEDYRNEVRLASELGFDFIGIGDSPAAWHDVYLSMSVAAQAAPKATISTWVTSPFVRHPLAVANSFAALNHLHGDRIAVGLSTGGSNTMAISHKPATQVQIRDFWQATRDLLDGKPATYDGQFVSALHNPCPSIPIYYSAFGPKALALAGEKADGVIVFTNGDMDELDAKIAQVHAGARAAGRNPNDVETLVTAFCSIRDSRAEALQDLKAFIVVNGMALRTPELLAQVPEQYRAALAELHKRYDPTEHVVVGGKNARLLDELGLIDFLGGFDCVAGTPDYVRGVIDGLKARGVSTFVINMPGHADKLGTLRRVSKLMGKS